MRPWVMMLVGALALVLGASALAADMTTADPRDLGAKPILRTLQAGQAPRTQPIASPEALAHSEIAQSKPVLWLLRSAERERRSRNVEFPPEPSTAVARCMGTKAVMWTLSRCGEEAPEMGAASGRP